MNEGVYFWNARVGMFQSRLWITRMLQGLKGVVPCLWDDWVDNHDLTLCLV